MISFEQIIKGINLKPTKGAFGYASITLIKDIHENILFDTGGYGVRSIIQELLKTEKIDKLFISHLHFDHCSNLDLFKDTKIYISKMELDNLYNNNEDYDLYKPILNILDKYNIIQIEEEEAISENVNIIFTHGHTVGHTSLEFEWNNKKVLVAGDSIKSLNDYLNDNEYGNAQNPMQYVKMKKFLKDNYDLIIPGHSDIIDRSNLINNQLNLRIF